MNSNSAPLSLPIHFRLNLTLTLTLTSLCFLVSFLLISVDIAAAVAHSRDACNGLAPINATLSNPYASFPPVNPRQIHVGVTLGYADAPGRPQAWMGIELARNVINSRPPFSNGNWTMELHFINEDCAASDVNAVQQLITQSAISILFGTACSVSSTPVSLLSNYYDLPVLSPTATSSKFSDKSVYPYFNRIWNPQKPAVISMLRLFKYFGWSHAVLISTNEPFGQDFIDLFKFYGAQAGVQVDLVVQYPLQGYKTAGRVESFLPPLLSTSVKVFVLWSFEYFDMKAIMEWAKKNGITGSGTAWLGTDEMWGDILSGGTNGDIIANFQGFMTIARDSDLTQSRQEYRDWLTLWNNTYPNVPVDLYGALDGQYNYDGIYAIGLSMGNLLNRGVPISDGKSLNAELREVQFEGMYAPFSLDENGDPEGFPFTVRNLVLDSAVSAGYKFSTFGSNLAAPDYARSNAWTFSGLAKPNFPGRVVGDSFVPIDLSAQIYISYSVPIAILSFVCACLGSWCCLILIEQLVFDHRTYLGWLKSTKHSSSTKEKFTRTLPIFVSLTSSSASLAFCGLWSSIYINQYQLKFSGVANLAATFNPLPSLISVLPALILIMASFLLIVHSASTQISKESDKRRHQDWNTGASMEFSTMGSTTTGGGSVMGTPTKSDPIHGSHPVVGPGDSNEKISKQRKINLDSKLEILMEVVLRFNFTSLAAALLMSAALLVVNLLELTSLSIASTKTSLDSGLLVGCAIFGFCSIAIALQSFIYLLRFRAIAAIVMAAGIWGSNEMLLKSISLTFDAAAGASPSTNFSESILLIIAVSIAAVSSLLLLSLQFQRMKLSRNSLDLLVLDLRKENAGLKKKIQLEKNNVAHIDAQLKYNQFLDDCNRLMRPCFRTASGAISLSQYQLISPSTCSFSISTIEKYLLQRCETGGVPYIPIAPLTKKSPSTINAELTTVPGSVTPDIPDLHGETNDRVINHNSSINDYQELFDESADHVNILNHILRHMKLASELYLDVLRHPFGVELLKDFTIGQHSAENVQFWCEIERYKGVWNNRKLRMEMCGAILADFLADGAPHQINLSAQIRSKTIAQIASNCGEINVFDSAQEEIFHLMASSIFPQFCLTPQFKSAISIFAIIRPPKFSSNSLTYLSPEQRERRLIGSAQQVSMVATEDRAIYYEPQDEIYGIDK